MTEDKCIRYDEYLADIEKYYPLLHNGVTVEGRYPLRDKRVHEFLFNTRMRPLLMPECKRIQNDEVEGYSFACFRAADYLIETHIHEFNKFCKEHGYPRYKIGDEVIEMDNG